MERGAMGYLFGNAAELLALCVMGFVQWQIGSAALSYVRRQAGGRAARAARVVLQIAGVLLLVGLLLCLPLVGAIVPAFRWLAILRGIALMWAFASAGSWIIYRLLWFSTRRFDEGRRKLLRTAGSAAIGAPFAIVGFGALVNRTAFHVREVEARMANLHPDLEGLRLVQISDIHLSPFLSEAEFARVVDAANELKAHAVLVTGDLISMRGDPLDACLRQIARLRSDAGVYGCMGNHEEYAEVRDYTASQGERLGIPFLRSQAKTLRFGGAALNLAGVDYQHMKWRGHYLDNAEQLIVPGALNILMSHNPDVFPTAASQGWDLTLAGHTHGGQVNIEILNQDLNVARFYTPYVYGLYQTGRSSIYVTRGIGTIGMPARLGAPPEITLLRLRKA
jgi:predicted MPP superfamily phosphohydrolase